jgi:hypothetical protein
MEDVLDDISEERPKPPAFWPSIVMGGFGGGFIMVVFSKVAGDTAASGVFFLVLSFIVLNTSLNHYRSKLGSDRSFITSFLICLAVYSLMTTSYLLVVGIDIHLDFSILTSIIDRVAGAPLAKLAFTGVVVSLITAALSRPLGSGE